MKILVDTVRKEGLEMLISTGCERQMNSCEWMNKKDSKALNLAQGYKILGETRHLKEKHYGIKHILLKYSIKILDIFF